MKSNTQSGLLFLMISSSISLILIFLLYSFSYSIDQDNFSQESFRFFTALLPLSMITISAGILSLIGVLFVFSGRKEFGSAHEKSIKYAIILFVVTVVVMIVITVTNSFLTFFYSAQNVSTANSGSSAQPFLHENFLLCSFASVISAALSGLIWVFGLYQLEDDTGKKLLLAAYVSSVATACIIAWNSTSVFHELYSSGVLQEIQKTGVSSFSSLSSYYPWIGATRFISLIGNIITTLLLLGALYIPYRRIKTEELAVLFPSAGGFLNIAKTSGYSDRHCPNCGRSIPFDALVCPYCGKKFEQFPKNYGTSSYFFLWSSSLELLS